MNTFTLIYTVLGGLGVFFYGMKNMSDALQALAGNMIKNIINTLTTNRILAVAVGIVVTTLVQSSSVTTVMTIGLVNAGLMKLTQAIGIVFGANIGTTITGWIISIKIGKYGLLFIALGVYPLLFGKSVKGKQIGRALFGIGMIFFGLQLMSGAFKPLRTNPDFLDAISFFSGEHYGAYLASVAIGCLLTMIVQSSSAMLGITIAMAMSGTISFHTAAALVLGENIGTTITALLASVGTNVTARRTAKAHALFNLLGVSAILLIFPYYIQFIEWLVPGKANFINSAGDKPNIAVHIATSHTIFNVAATIIFLPFINTLAKVVTKLTPEKEIKGTYHLKMLGNPNDSMPVTALIQAQTEVVKMKEIIDKMFTLTEEYLKSSSTDSKLLTKIKSYEDITDNIQKEITVFMFKVLQKRLTPEQSAEAQGLVKLADELESIADYIDRLATDKTRSQKENTLEGSAGDDFFGFYKKVKQYYDLVTLAIVDSSAFDKNVAKRESNKLHQIAESMRQKHLERISKGEYQPETALVFSDMVVSLRKIRSHVLNVSQAIGRTLKARQNS